LDIFINNVSKSFGDKVVLRNFSATLYEHRYNCIMGPSGCGKTTLLNMLMGLLKPDSGTITGVPQKKSTVFQEDRLCESFSAVSNIRMVLSKRTDTETIREHLAFLGLKEDSIYLPVHELSGGMRRRVAIVRAMLAESEIVFLDEPFKGLDIETKKTAIQYVKANSRGRTVILVTHDKAEAEEMNGNIIRMELLDQQSDGSSRTTE